MAVAVSVVILEMQHCMSSFRLCQGIFLFFFFPFGFMQVMSTY